jgi:hypothetical protein
MRRTLIVVLLAFALGGCVSYGGGYYDRTDGHGDYYHGAGPIIGYSGPGWYAPYDALFWSLRYSYFDPFWYPNFHYGITYFPRYYYGWPYWNAGSYWRWRGYHPYSPHYGSWWDHYYHWQRPSGPRRHLGPGGRGYGGSGPERYGSARNAAERMAQGRPYGAYQRSALSRDPAVGASLRQRATPFEPGGLPSSRYAPRGSFQRSDAFQRGRAGDGFGPGLERRQRGPALDSRSPAVDPSGRMRLRSEAPSGLDAGMVGERTPAFRTPAPRSMAPAAPSRRAESAPRSRSSFDRPSPVSDRGSSRPDSSFSSRGGMDRSSSGSRGGGRERSER